MVNNVKQKESIQNDPDPYTFMDSLFLEEYKDMDAMNLVTDRTLRVEEAEDAIILPYREINGKKKAGVVKSSGEYIELSSFQALSDVDSWGGKYLPEKEPDYIRETVVYFGRFWSHWGHFLMDEISRLWYFLENGEDPGMRFVYDSPEKISGIYLEFLKLLGIQESQLMRIERPTRFSRVIVPECSHQPGILVHPMFRKMFDRAAEAALAALPDGVSYCEKKIYFTRRQLNRRIPTEIGEKEIEDLFRTNGFLVAAPEKCSLTEQIAMVRQAEEIACVSGTLPHNMIFAKDHAKVCIVRKTNKPTYRQVSVNQIRALNVINIDAHISLKPVGPNGPFWIEVNENVRRYLLWRGWKEDRHAISAWIKRKGRLFLWYGIYLYRNIGRKYEVPVFIDGQFSTYPDARERLFRFYFKRV